MEFIVNELEKNEDKRVRYKIKAIKDDVLKSGRIVLKSVDVSLSPISLSFENRNVDYENIENLIKKIQRISEILKESNKKLIVFIDELDRCEPEHILELFSLLKTVFSACNSDENKNITYFVAIDKEVAIKAVRTKYKDEIKIEEYLEKIFNISFNMPKCPELKDFIKSYTFFNDDETAEKLAKFFEAINFTNPRHLKKVLNKYTILIEFKSSKIDDGLMGNHDLSVLTHKYKYLAYNISKLLSFYIKSPKVFKPLIKRFIKNKKLNFVDYVYLLRLPFDYPFVGREKIKLFLTNLLRH